VIRKPLATAQLQGENALARDDARHSEAISLDNLGRAFAWLPSFDVATPDYPKYSHFCDTNELDSGSGVGEV
jgi:hypothetical protein